MPSFTVDLKDAVDPLVLAVDVGSTASRGGLYDGRGLPVDRMKHKVPHAFTTATDGTSVIDPLQVVDEVAAIIDALARPELAGRIAGVALDTFASSLVGVDAAGEPLTPCYTYADSRCAPQVNTLRAELDEAQVQQRTGTRLHSSYLPARLRWLHETHPGVVARVRRWMSLGELVVLRLTGTTAVGTSTAAWTGLLDRLTGTWDEGMLAVAGITPDTLSPVHHPDQPLTGLTTRWPALAGAAWFPVVTDGLAANIGTGATDARTVVASFATSGAVRVRVPAEVPELPSGLWAYRVDAEHALLGGALNDVGRAVSWLEATLKLDGVDLDGVLAADPDPTTPLALPFLTGERSTGWAADARAVVAGLSAASTPAAIARGLLEGVALSYGRVVTELTRVAPRPEQILASGRMSQSLPHLLQLLADVTGVPVTPVTIKRSTLHGTALLALESLAPQVERAAPTTAATVEPVAGRADYYAERAERFAALYSAVVG
ncbi:gluconokinase [Georgenia satyanarayanai]|uniref:gluconokinase n=1 Tax=Georgenia satyanarayanai TaxID=860221 RepID=UPI00203AE35E|nr:gluconokinase [Georgenia satyanarayanai]MCM3661853.1 gluconokinase [Georgenia satyanarayanai]